MKLIIKSQILPKPLKVNPVNNMKYQVINGTSQYVIYLPTKVYSCRMRDILEIPYAHACAVFIMKHLSIKSYVSPLYLNSILSSIYRDVINPFKRSLTMANT
uniref:Uncharacterized protein n=1 Tax=Cucumis melo TaxID=3656 RepID=A0A9I9E883_CUCME